MYSKSAGSLLLYPSAHSEYSNKSLILYTVLHYVVLFMYMYVYVHVLDGTAVLANPLGRTTSILTQDICMCVCVCVIVDIKYKHTVITPM